MRTNWTFILIGAAAITLGVTSGCSTTHEIGKSTKQLVRGETMRGKFRNSFEKPEPFEPGKLAKIEYVLPDVDHTFRRGHRIMVQVQSSWFPLFDRNPQTFVDIPRAKPPDYRKATQRVYRTRELPSHVTVLVVPRI